jgi:hypothetical protein
MRTRTIRRLTAGKSFVRDPGSNKPFKRAFALMERMAEIVGRGLQPIDRQIELESLPPYVSRGHGGRHRPKQRLVGGRQFQDRSKYDPREENTKHLRAPSPQMVEKLARRRAMGVGL